MVAVKLEAMLILETGRDLISSVLLGLWKNAAPNPMKTKQIKSCLISFAVLIARNPRAIMERAMIDIPRAARYLN